MSPGGGFPPGDIVERMVLCYHTRSLAYQHLHATSPLLPYVVPELEARGILESAVRVYLLLTRLTQSRTVDRLLALAECRDNGTNALIELDGIISELQELVQPCLELDVYWRCENRPGQNE